MSTPSPQTIRSAADAAKAAAEFMRQRGYDDAAPLAGESKGEIHVMSSSAIARVRADAAPAEAEDVQALYGVARLEGKDPFFFSLAGYTPGAEAWAKRAGVSIFGISVTGDVEEPRQPARGAEGPSHTWSEVVDALKALEAAELAGSVEGFSPAVSTRWRVRVSPDHSTFVASAEAPSPEAAELEARIEQHRQQEANADPGEMRTRVFRSKKKSRAAFRDATDRLEGLGELRRQLNELKESEPFPRIWGEHATADEAVGVIERQLSLGGFGLEDFTVVVHRDAAATSGVLLAEFTSSNPAS